MLPINGNLQSLSIATNSQPISNPTLLMIDQWKMWAEQSQPGLGERRDVALLRLIECLELRVDSLDLQSLHLTQLPPTLPDNIIELNLSNNQFTFLPETLPTELEILDVSHNQLTHLPDTLPTELRELNVSYNQLAQLPATLPSEILTLNICHNQLIHLPETLPTELTKLNVSHNHLTQLPDSLPRGLETLRVNNNQLTHLPETLPTGLETLKASHNRLTELPARLPVMVEILEVDYNGLTYLPSHLPPHLMSLDVSNNPLINHSEASRLFNGVVISDSDVYDNPPTLPLRDTLRLWDKACDIKQWEKIALEENADHFSHFLKTLHQRHNASNTSLQYIVAAWLTELAKEENQAIRQQTFAIAQMGSESCVDRASYYFNQMHSLLIEHRLTHANASISDTVNTLRSLFRLQTLEKISAEHAIQRRREASGFKEDIEIYLAYQYKLKDELALPVHTALQFESIANLTDTDLEKAKNQILDKEKQEFLRHLVNHSDVWQKKIEAWDGQKWDQANACYLKEITSSEFQQAVENALKQEGIPIIDEDAMRIMQQKLASDRLFQIRYPLTETLLKEHNALSLIEKEDNLFKKR